MWASCDDTSSDDDEHNTSNTLLFALFLPTPSSRLSFSRAFPTWTSSWLYWGAGLPWTFSPLLSKTGPHPEPDPLAHDPGYAFWFWAATPVAHIAFSTGGRASMSFVRMVLDRPLKVHLASPDFRPALRMVALEFIFVPVFLPHDTTVFAYTTSCTAASHLPAVRFFVFCTIASLLITAPESNFLNIIFYQIHYRILNKYPTTATLQDMPLFNKVKRTLQHIREGEKKKKET